MTLVPGDVEDGRFDRHPCRQLEHPGLTTNESNAHALGRHRTTVDRPHERHQSGRARADLRYLTVLSRAVDAWAKRRRLTRVASLIAKIRKWLRIEKKP